MASRTELLDLCLSTVDTAQPFIVIFTSIASMVIWYVLYTKRVRAIQPWRRPRGRPPNNDTREAEYIKEQLRLALIGGNPIIMVACASSILVSLSTLIIAGYTVFSGDDAVFLWLQSRVSWITCAVVPGALLRKIQSSATPFIWNLVVKFSLLTLNIVFVMIDWLVNLFRSSELK